MVKFNVSYDISQLESNKPGEDRFCVVQRNNLFGFAVIDGHGGYLAADIAGEHYCDNNIRHFSFFKFIFYCN
jgi:serine/threonine protein phosphatase PrpC